MPPVRLATLTDIPLITEHRHRMFGDNQFATEERLDAMDIAFAPWLRAHLADNTYIGLLIEEQGEVVAGAGIFYQDFPPHYLHLEPTRAYLLNFYTAPHARGRGYANTLLCAAVDECRSRGIQVLTLHASPFGKPIYTKFGFTDSNEMLLQLAG